MDEKKKEIDKIRMNRVRGWIVAVVYGYRPELLEFAMIKHLLSRRGIYLSTARLAKELTFLRDEDLVKVRRLRGTDLSKAEQELMLAEYAQSSGEYDDAYSVGLTPKGCNFQEGDIVVTGVHRING